VSRVDQQSRFQEIELAPGADPQALLRRVVETGATVRRFELVQPSLHQIFLEKVGAGVRSPGAPAWSAGVEAGMSGHG
jgi:ABC-2 type transport system ATP-binding protein